MQQRKYTYWATQNDTTKTRAMRDRENDERMKMKENEVEEDGRMRDAYIILKLKRNSHYYY